MVKIVTNPPHFSRFDVTTEKMISGPVEAKMEGWTNSRPATPHTPIPVIAPTTC